MAGPAARRELSIRGFLEAEDGEGDLARVVEGILCVASDTVTIL